MTIISRESEKERKKIVQALKNSLEQNTPWHFRKNTDLATIWGFIYDELVRMTTYDSLIDPKCIFKLEFYPARNYLVVSAIKRRATAMKGLYIRFTEEKIITSITRAINHYGLEIKKEEQKIKPGHCTSKYATTVFIIYAKAPPNSDNKNEFKLEE